MTNFIKQNKLGVAIILVLGIALGIVAHVVYVKKTTEVALPSKPEQPGDDEEPQGE